MFPEKHLKELESSERKSKIFGKLVLLIFFITGFVFFGPLIHELGHLAILELKGCNYIFNIGFVFPHGLNAGVSPLCAITPGYLILFYSIGYLLTLCLGVGLNITGSILESKYSSAMIYTGTGMLLSVIPTIGIKGDIQNALAVMNLDPTYSIFIALLIVLGVFAGSIQGIKDLIDSER